MSEMITCASCGRVNPLRTPPAEMLAELAEVWPGVPTEDCDIICEVCWQITDPRLFPPDGHPQNNPPLFEKLMDIQRAWRNGTIQDRAEALQRIADTLHPC